MEQIELPSARTYCILPLFYRHASLCCVLSYNTISECAAWAYFAGLSWNGSYNLLLYVKIWIVRLKFTNL